MTCLSRMDEGKNIFDNNQRAQLGKKKRWNFYAELDIKNGKLICQNETYYIDDVCDIAKGGLNCILKNSPSLEINPR